MRTVRAKLARHVEPWPSVGGVAVAGGPFFQSLRDHRFDRGAPSTLRLNSTTPAILKVAAPTRAQR